MARRGLVALAWAGLGRWPVCGAGPPRGRSGAEWVVVSCQLSVVSCQLSVVSCQAAVGSGQWAVWAADAGEAEVQVAAAEELAGDVADDRPLRSVTRGVTLVVGAFELGQVPFDQPIKGRGARLARAIDGVRQIVWRRKSSGFGRASPEAGLAAAKSGKTDRPKIRNGGTRCAGKVAVEADGEEKKLAAPRFGPLCWAWERPE